MEKKLILRTVIQLIFILPVCFQYGCVTTKHKYQAYQDMKEFVLDNYNRNGGYLLFFKTHAKNRIICRDTYDLQNGLRLSPKFKGIDIESYFKDIMMEKIILSCGDDLSECFTLSPAIMDEYKKEGIEKFIKAHTKHDKENNSYIINPNFSYDEKLSIAYCFYLNNIYTIIDDYTGYFMSWKNLLDIPTVVTDTNDFKEIQE